jgi:ABC-type Fe3+/spermidine/putrescine transport system ATPase subunit
VQIGTPEDIFERPSDSFVASFMGSANLISARVIGHDASKVIVRTEHGAVFSVESSKTHRSGEPVVIVLRPERIRFATTANEPEPAPAVVEDIIYLGTALRFILRFGNDRLTVIARPDGVLRTLKTGSEIRIDLAGSDPIILSRTDEIASQT